MRAGNLRRRIVLQSATETRASDGGVVRTWSAYATVWASVEPLTGREYQNAAQQVSEVSHKVRLRYVPGATRVKSQHRILYNGRIFQIVSVANVEERNREMELMCKETATGSATGQWVGVTNDDGNPVFNDAGDPVLTAAA